MENKLQENQFYKTAKGCLILAKNACAEASSYLEELGLEKESYSLYEKSQEIATILKDKFE